MAAAAGAASRAGLPAGRWSGPYAALAPCPEEPRRSRPEARNPFGGRYAHMFLAAFAACIFSASVLARRASGGSGNGARLSGSWRVVSVSGPTRLLEAPSPSGQAPAGYRIAYRDAWCEAAPLYDATCDSADATVHTAADSCAQRCSEDAACQFFVWGWNPSGYYRCATFTECSRRHEYLDGDPSVYQKQQVPAAAAAPPPPASETSTTTSSATTTTTLAFQEPVTESGPPMYCFTVARMTSDEGDLVKCQFRRGAGIFGCNAYSVFSDTRFVFSQDPVVETYTLPVPLGSPDHVAGAETAGYVNTELFLRVWRQIMGLPLAWNHQWTVKVDPDTVFFPNRLRESLLPYGADEMYVRNCPGGPRGLGMFGALEVVSKTGLAVYHAGWKRCVEALKGRQLGEDNFMQKCLDLLGVAPRDNPDLLADGYCPGRVVDCTASFPAFHPFKTVDGFFRCWEESGGTTLTPVPGAPASATCTAPPWPPGALPRGPANGIRPPPPAAQPKQAFLPAPPAIGAPAPLPPAEPGGAAAAGSAAP